MNRKLIKEGKASIYIFPGEIKKSDVVFYNPKMHLNRDISSLAVKAFTSLYGRSVRVLDVMASTGIRGIRYALECSNVKEVVFNDLNPNAISLLKENVALNELEKNVEVEIYNEDANVVMHKYRFEGDVVDVDPFGSAMPYVDSLARCVSNKGMIMATFTDTAVLSGTYPRTALRRYGVYHSRKYYPKGEIALRVAYKVLAEALARYDKGIIPLVGLSYQHYVRVIAMVDKHKSSAEQNISMLKYLHFNEMQERFYSFNKEEGKEYESIGPIWSGPLGNESFIGKMLEMYDENVYLKETYDLLSVLQQEYKIGNMEGSYYYHIPHLGKYYKSTLPSYDNVEKYIRSKGYHVSKSHIKDYTIVTDMPYQELVGLFKRF